MTEVVQWIARTVDTVEIPVIADMDSGYGNAVNVVRSVREYEKTGVAAFHLEDQISPKKCGHYEGKQLVTKAEMVGKIKAAVDTRRDADMVIIARTDARAVEGLQAALDRMNAYLDAGADVGFVEAPQNAQELAAIPKAFSKPALANIFEGGKTPPLPRRELEAMGYRIGIYRRRRIARHCRREKSARGAETRRRHSGNRERTRDFHGSRRRGQQRGLARDRAAVSEGRMNNARTSRDLETRSRRIEATPRVRGSARRRGVRHAPSRAKSPDRARAHCRSRRQRLVPGSRQADRQRHV